MGYRRVDTTADVGIEVWARDFKELLEEAARGTFSLISDISKVKPESEEKVSVKGLDKEDLLISFLNEILYLKDAKGFIPKDVKILKLSNDLELEALLLGESFDPKRHELLEDLKAATYHNIQIKKEGELLKTKIIFDV